MPNQGARFISLSEEQSNEFHEALLKCLRKINEYFDSTSRRDRARLEKDVDRSVKLVNSFAKIRQTETAQGAVLIQAVNMAGGVLGERVKNYLLSGLPVRQLTEGEQNGEPQETAGGEESGTQG